MIDRCQGLTAAGVEDLCGEANVMDARTAEFCASLFGKCVERVDNQDKFHGFAASQT